MDGLRCCTFGDAQLPDWNIDSSLVLIPLEFPATAFSAGTAFRGRDALWLLDVSARTRSMLRRLPQSKGCFPPGQPRLRSANLRRAETSLAGAREQPFRCRGR